MNGTHHVVVRNRDVVYEFDLNRNITVIRGDSGTGKTRLYEMIVRHAENKGGVTISCDKRCDYLQNRLWETQLKDMHNCIIFTDEGQRFVCTKEFAEAIKGTDNYYVLITRRELYELPISVDEIYKIKASGKYHTLKRIYEHNDKHAYFQGQPGSEKEFSVLLTEDSRSGFHFISWSDK